MTESTKTLLIIGGVALIGYLIYNKVTTAKPRQVLAGPGPGQTVSGSTSGGSTGSANFWQTLGNVGQGLNAGVSSVESTYNNIYDLFGGQPSTTGTGQGNNGTAG